MIIEVVFSTLATLLSPTHLLYLCLGVMLGLAVGILPGLGGVAGLSLVLPFTFGMEPSLALAMMIGLIVPTTTSDTFASVLMGIPGSSASQATVVDGFPLAKRGEGARALSASFIASLIGGVIGAVVLSVCVMFSRPIILAFGFGEQLMLVVFSLSMVGMLTGNSALKGLAACGLGLLLGSIGAAPATGEYRMTFGTVYLVDGVSIIIMGLGLFAVPEIIDLLRRDGAIAASAATGTGWLKGFMDVVRHRWIVVRCSLLGCLLGALPGVGGAVIDWIAYGHVVQTSKDRSQFGKGDIRGVIAPESATNSKDGGSLIPTLLFGIPGSGTMAVLLGGFILVGIEPGSGMVTQHLDLTFLMIWSLTLANVIGTAVCFLIAPQVTRITNVRYALVGPLMIVLIMFAAFQVSRSFTDLVGLLMAGLLGVYMKRFGWPRPALLIGFVLSLGLESSVYQAIQVYGMRFFERPVVLVILALTVISVGVTLLSRAPRIDTEQGVGVEPGSGGERLVQRLPQLGFTLLLGGLVGFAILDAAGRSYLSKVFPLAVGGITLALIVLVLFFQLRADKVRPIHHDAGIGTSPGSGTGPYMLWIAGFVISVLAVGFPLAAAGFVFLFTSVRAGWHPVRNGLLAVGVIGVLGGIAHFLALIYPGGVLQSLVRMPVWMGRGL